MALIIYNKNIDSIWVSWQIWALLVELAGTYLGNEVSGSRQRHGYRAIEVLRS